VDLLAQVCSLFSELTLKESLGLYGAALSTILGMAKLFEVWSRRFRLEIGHSFSDQQGATNTIAIHNLAPTPITLTYWEVLDISAPWPFRKATVLRSPGEDAFDIAIAGHASGALVFGDEEPLPWGSDLHGNMYVLLHFAGRRPIRIRVT
jgi:hypothetical protein